MIQAELKTPLRWYNDIRKQNRYKSYCSASCDFSLVTQMNIVPPFQFDTELIAVNILSWTFHCKDGTEVFSAETGILEKIDSLTKVTTDYIQYTGLSTVPDLDLDCGTYYMIIETDQGDFYSELIHFEDFEAPAFVQMNLPIFTAWRWYDDVQKQNKFKSNCVGCEFFLIMPTGGLIPFQFRIPGEESPEITRWVLRNEDCEYVLNHELILSHSSIDSLDDAYNNIYYTGLIPPTQLTEIELPNGDFSGAGSWDETFSSDPADIGWDIDSNRARFLADGPGAGSAIFANSLTPFLTIQAGVTYYITYTIILLDGNGISFQIRAGGTLGQSRTEAGTFQDIITAESTGVIELIGKKTTVFGDGEIRVDNISVYIPDELPCGRFESVVTIDGVEYFSEWIEVIGEQENDDADYLLLESGDYLLLESGDKILLEIQD